MTSNLRRVRFRPGVLHHLDRSPRSAARRGITALFFAAWVELGIVQIAQAADWPAGAFYTVSALALAILVALLVPIIEPPRPPARPRAEQTAERVADLFRALEESLRAVRGDMPEPPQHTVEMPADVWARATARALAASEREPIKDEAQLDALAQRIAAVQARIETRILDRARERVGQEQLFKPPEAFAALADEDRLRATAARLDALLSDPDDPLTSEQRVVVLRYLMLALDNVDTDVRVEVGVLLGMLASERDVPSDEPHPASEREI